MDQLTQLKEYTQVVADTGEIEPIKKYQPLDATTNPSLILKAIQKKEFQFLLKKAIQQSKKEKKNQLNFSLNKIAVLFGVEILKIIKGKISTEVDARLSFNQEATIRQAEEIIKLYQEEGVDVKRILIKIAATWEGIQAAAELEKRGICCNITLLFSHSQAIAAANANSYLISPFVGRILDWYKKNNPAGDFSGKKDPGVIFVKQVYELYKNCGISTIVMGASFRNIEQIRQLAGCDKLTISPNLLEELSLIKNPLQRQLMPSFKKQQLQNLNKKEFQRILAQDTMASEKLKEGINLFSQDTKKLEQIIKDSF